MKKLLLFCAAIALFAFPSCNDDDNGGGSETLNLKLDYSQIVRPAKGNRYRVYTTSNKKWTIAPIEAHSLKVPAGETTILVMSNLFRYDYDGPVFYLPLTDGYLTTPNISPDDQFGYGMMDTIAEKGKIVEPHLSLKSIPNIQVAVNVTNEVKNRITSVTWTLDRLHGAWNYLTDEPVGGLISMKTYDSNKRNDYESEKYMYMGFDEMTTKPVLRMKFKFDDLADTVYYEREVDFDTVTRAGKMWYPTVTYPNGPLDSTRMRMLYILRDSITTDKLFPPVP